MPIHDAHIRLAGTGGIKRAIAVRVEDDTAANLCHEAQCGKGPVLTVPVKMG
jgi:hypothetical protein